MWNITDRLQIFHTIMKPNSSPDPGQFNQQSNSRYNFFKWLLDDIKSKIDRKVN